MDVRALARLAFALGGTLVAACGLDWKSRGADAGAAEDASAVAVGDGSAVEEGDAADSDGAAEVDGAEPPSADGDAATGAGDADVGDAAPNSADLVPEEGLLLWLRADRGVTSANGQVLTWADQSPEHADTGQLTADYRPALVATPNTLPAVVFDGVDDFLSVPAGFADFSAGLTIVIVASIAPAALQVPLFEASNGAEIDDVNLSRLDGGMLLEVDQQYANSSSIEGDRVQLLVASLTPGLDAVERQNGLTIGTARFDQLPVSVRRNQVFVGKSLYKDVKVFGGALHELLVYGRALADAELLELELRLSRRWRCCIPVP
jgi:hypothetical protein